MSAFTTSQRAYRDGTTSWEDQMSAQPDHGPLTPYASAPGAPAGSPTPPSTGPLRACGGVPQSGPPSTQISTSAPRSRRCPVQLKRRLTVRGVRSAPAEVSRETA